ncbi:MAG: efflux RND transporter permease subunit, partial [Mucinivorans sp.]
VRAKGEFSDSKQLDDIVVANRDGRQVYLPEVATIVDTIKKITMDERINGQLGVRIIVQKQSGANSVAIAKEVIDMIPQIQKQLPPDIKLGVLVDMSQSIRDSISSLSDTIMYAFLFVVIVVLFFLGRWRATFIIVLTIPVSLIVAFIYLKMVDSTLNIISLSSLSIAIGMVVDDAIVVLENITKHIERGSTAKNAAIYATNEVWLAVIATTLVIVAVFLPLTMLSGMAGIMFRELGWIVTLVSIVSTAAAISMTPMLSSLLLKLDDKKQKGIMGAIFNPIDRMLDRLDNGYGNILAWSVRHRTVLLLIALAIFASSILLLNKVPSEFFPTSDNGRIQARVELEQGVNIQYTAGLARHIDSIIAAKYPEVDVLSTSTGAASGDNIFAAMQKTGTHIINYNLSLPPSAQRTRSIFEIGDSLRVDLEHLPEIVQSNITVGAGGPSTSTSDVMVKIFGYDMMGAEILANQIRDSIAAEVPGAKDVQLSRDKMRPEYRIIFDRDRLGNYGLNTATASMYVRNRINGLLASKYREDGDEYDIYVRYDEQYRTTKNDIEEITIYNAQNRPIKLKDVAQVTEEFAAPTIERENRERMISVNMNLAAGAALSTVVADVQKIIDRTTIPEGLYTEIGGSYEDQQESFGDLITLLILIIILVYIVMATQFESFKMPFIILFSLPFAFTGVFLALYLTGTALSVIALIGAIMLVGIVVKNGIVMVDFTNLLRERGLSVSQSVVAAGKSRLRPVLMTTLTTILGMFPLALGLGEGSEIWQPMGIAVIGGLTFSTILTLIVVPIVYTVFSASNIKRKRKQIRKVANKK